MRQGNALASTTIILLLLVGALVLATGSSIQPAYAAPTKYFGFWLQEGDIYQHYSASAFFNAMFLTPPYPSSVEVMIFGPLQNEKSNLGCSTSAYYTGTSVSYWNSVASLADSYPNIRLIFDIAFDPSSSVYGLSCFKSVVNALATHSSVYGLGIEGEYTRPQTPSLYTTAQGYVTAYGKQFINYYAAKGVIPSGGYSITHTNFPGGDAGGYDQVGTLQNYDSQTVGIDSGYYSSFPFPGTVTCPVGVTAMNGATAGWNQCVVNTEFSTASTFSPASARTYLEIDVGFSSSGSFTGVSKQTTNQLWDNPTLRGWITSWLAVNPGTYLKSNGATTSSPSSISPTSTSTSMRKLLTSTSTTSTSSTSTSMKTTSSTAISSKSTGARELPQSRSWPR
jgi:hypothetical protein